MGSVAIVVFVKVIQGDSLAPRCTSLELLVVDVDASVNDVDINTLTAIMIIFILGESAEGELWAVANTRETLKDVAMSQTRGERNT